MRISDWSSDVCSSDLEIARNEGQRGRGGGGEAGQYTDRGQRGGAALEDDDMLAERAHRLDPCVLAWFGGEPFGARFARDRRRAHPEPALARTPDHRPERIVR